jgi:hypothetical protein
MDSKLFNIDKIIKQIDFPNINQIDYKNIIRRHIVILGTDGHMYEIFKYMLKMNSEIYKILEKIGGLYMGAHPYYKVPKLTLTEIDVSKLIITKPWKTITDNINLLYKLDPDGYGDTADGIQLYCFILGIPIYNTANVCKITFINDNTEKYIILSNEIIRICASTSDRTMNSDEIQIILNNFISKKHKLKLDLYMNIIFPDPIKIYSLREVMDVVNVPPIEKNLFTAIYDNGLFMVSEKRPKNLWYTTFNIESNQIFIGFCDDISDKNIIKYINTDTILFVLDSCISGSRKIYI